MKKTLSLILVMLIICGCLSGCNSSNKGNAPANEQQGLTDSSRTVTDMLGRQIEFSGELNRVYFDWASGITLAMTLGVTDKLAAKQPAFEGESFAWARVICPAINDVPTEDDSIVSGNVESILALEPEVVFTSTRENVESYEKLGLKTVFVNFNDHESFKESLLIVGTAIGADELAAAERYNALLDSNIAMVAERTSEIADADKPTVYYMDSRFNDAYHTVGTGEIQESWITCAGGILATAADFEGRNLEITAEKLLELDPDIIVIGAQTQADVYDMLMSDPVLSELSAVKESHVYRLPQGIFPWCRTGPEAAIQVIWAGQFLHPELFDDIDIKTVAKDFYKDFYGTDVSDEYLDEILSGHLYPNGR